MASKIMLAKSVIKAFLTYSMQATAIPSITLSKIKRYERAFIWGYEAHEQKIHTIAWNKICSPKEVGGLGFCDLRNEQCLFNEISMEGGF